MSTTTRTGIAVCLLAALLFSIVVRAPSARAVAASGSTCATSGAPSQFPYGFEDPAVFSTDFTTHSVPQNWWVPPTTTTFNQYTTHDPANVVFSGSAMQLTNAPDPNGTQQDMGIAGENPLLQSAGAANASGDNLVVAWCARVTDDPHVDTDFELGQADSRPWPPEIDLAEGAGNHLTVILHWTCDASIPGCPTRDGYFNGTVAKTGPYTPWPPPGVSVGSHYFCNWITNASGQQVYNDPSDGHFDYNCRAEINLPLPSGVTVSDWNEYGAAFNPSGTSLAVWVDNQRPVVVDARSCGAHLLYDDNGVLPVGEIVNGGAPEPCLQNRGNWQWDIQQTEWMGRKTVPGLTKGQFDTADVAWFADYAYVAACTTDRCLCSNRSVAPGWDWWRCPGRTDG